MKLIRFLLSHIILLALLVVLGLAYYHRARLFSDDFTAKIDSTVHRVLVMVKLAPEGQQLTTGKTNQETTGQEAEAAQVETVVQDVAITDTPQAEVPEEVTSSSEAIASSPVVDDVPDTEQAQADEPSSIASQDENTEQETEQTADQENTVETEVASSAAVEPEVAEPEVAEPESVEPEDIDLAQTESATDEPLPATKPEQAPAASTDKEAVTKSHAELMNQARLTFNEGDSNKAVALYKELIDLNPDDPNAYGELGNVYYTQGQWKQAGQAYYEAASRLLARGQVEQVQYLYRVIHGLDQESAEKLRSQMGR